MTKEDVRQIRVSLGRTQAGFAAMLGVSVTTVYRWEHGVRPLPEFVRKLRVLRRYTKTIEGVEL